MHASSFRIELLYRREVQLTFVSPEKIKSTRVKLLFNRKTFVRSFAKEIAIYYKYPRYRNQATRLM